MIRFIVALSLMLLSTGCGRSDLPELGTVSGIVTVEGSPVADAIVNFTPSGPGRPSTGQTDSEGRFELMYLTDVYGAIVGEHVVTVELVVSEEMDDLPDDPSEMTDEQKEMKKLPPSASDSSIRKEVQPGSNEINIEL